MKRRSSILAGMIAALYIGLASAALTCLQPNHMRADVGGHHQHDSHATDSPLCDWACQATESEGLPTLWPDQSPTPALTASTTVLIVPPSLHVPIARASGSRPRIIQAARAFKLLLSAVRTANLPIVIGRGSLPTALSLNYSDGLR